MYLLKISQMFSKLMENPYTGSMKDYITEKPAVFDYCMFGFEYRKRTAIWSNTNLESVMCDKSHLINGRHQQTAIGASKTPTRTRRG